MSFEIQRNTTPLTRHDLVRWICLNSSDINVIHICSSNLHPQSLVMYVSIPYNCTTLITVISVGIYRSLHKTIKSKWTLKNSSIKSMEERGTKDGNELVNTHQIYGNQNSWATCIAQLTDFAPSNSLHLINIKLKWICHYLWTLWHNFRQGLNICQYNVRNFITFYTLRQNFRSCLVGGMIENISANSPYKCKRNTKDRNDRWYLKIH